MSLLHRQRLLLALLEEMGGHLSATDFQKHLFLYVTAAEPAPSYDFVPYRFGGFSFESYADRRRLVEAGLLEEGTGSEWTLVSAQPLQFRKAVPPAVRQRLVAHRRQFGQLTGKALVAETYRRSPYHAIHSTILGEVLPDAADRRAVEKHRPRLNGRALFTIGYEGISLDTFLNRLIRAGVKCLCDVRKNPISRKYGFAGKTLADACAKLGIAYRHLPELGIPGDLRHDLSLPGARAALFEDYRRTTLPAQIDALDQIRELLEEFGTVALTCFEHVATDCHRHCVAEALSAEPGWSTPVRDL